MKYLALTILTFFVVSCGSPSDNTQNQTASEQAVAAQKSIIIYGSNQCSHCLDFKAKLDSVGLNYTFNDVDVSDQHYNDMRNLIQAARVTGRVNFPIVLVDQTDLFIAPTLGEVLEVL